VNYIPPFEISSRALTSVAKISEKVGAFNATHLLDELSPRLRRSNTIQTVQASCAIEGNELTIEQVTAILEGKTVLGAPREIQEIKNALDVYESIDELSATSEKSLLSAHKMLMLGLLNDPGTYRRGGVGIQKGEETVHLAPPADNVRGLMKDLFKWLKSSDVHPLILSSVFHYEFEFIHPFSDGNGRMGRLWQTLILKEWNQLFTYVPIESMIRNNQEGYYEALNMSNRVGKSTPFIEFMLETIENALSNIEQTDQVGVQVSDQVKELVQIIGTKEVTVQFCMELLGVKHRPTFRKNRLNPAMEGSFVEMTQPDSPRSPSQKYRLTENGVILLKKIERESSL